MKAIFVRYGTLRVALMASLALNLILLGLMAGAAMHAREQGVRAFGPSIIRALPEDARREVRREMRAAFDRDSRREARRENRRALSASLSPLDQERAATLLRVERDGNAAVLEELHSAFLKAVARMSDEERAELAQRLNRRNGGERD